ncbi:hypothetical protein ACWDTD_10845 [Gordonia sp. NPDC003425]
MSATATRRRRATAMGALAVTALTLAGCASNPGPGASSSATPAGCATTSTSGQPDAKLIAIPPAAVTVTATGDQPRRLAAGTPDLATAQPVTLSTTSSVASAQTTTSQTVQTSMTARFACTDPTDVEMTLGAVTSPDTALADSLRAVAGARAGVAIAPGQVPISLRLIPTQASGSEARAAVEQSLVQALQNSVPLPTEPVGVGAMWRAERTLSAAATVTQTITARLSKWDGNRVTIDFATEEEPVDSVFTIPGGDATLTISRYTYSGTGQVTLDLSRGLPVAGNAEFSGARELTGADPANPLVQRLGFSFTWRS